MRALILGAKGMLGSMLERQLSDWETVGWDKADIDITQREETWEKVRQWRNFEGEGVIINAAAWTDVDAAEAEENREKVWAVNESAVQTLAEIAQKLDLIVVHYSTDYVFPGTSKTGYAEDDSPGPAVNKYGQSKLAGERALKEIGPRFYLLRTAWLYGSGGKNFVDTMLKLGRERDQLEVVHDQYGSPTFTKDLAQATRTLLTEQYPFGIYHAVNAGETTWHGFAQKIFEITKLSVKITPVTSEQFLRPAKRPKYSILKNTKGPKLRHWEDALADYLSSHDEIKTP